MNSWSVSVKSCRACLLQDNVCNMYDLAVPEVMELYTQTSNVGVTIKPNSPQHLCSMCYRLCELVEGFRERCQEADKKIQRGEKIKRKLSSRVSSSASDAQIVTLPQPEDYNDIQDVKSFEVDQTIDADPDTDVEGEPVEGPADPMDTAVLDQHGTHWDDESEESCEEVSKSKKPKRAKTKRKFSLYAGLPQNNELDNFTWGPGPNDFGVWKYFMRESTKKYAKCTIENCGRIMCCPNASTSGMRAHLSNKHGLQLPTKSRV